MTNDDTHTPTPAERDNLLSTLAATIGAVLRVGGHEPDLVVDDSGQRVLTTRVGAMRLRIVVAELGEVPE